ncbi:MAG: nucleoside-diphosphate kinase [Deltaproteobacteria bacterium]|nr:nucleoside-diphosphate kinase [Deltaproteobacteria bacterium]
MEKTLGIIKPDAVANGYVGKILAMATDEGFRIAALRMTRMALPTAQAFYAIHKDKPFYGELTEYMSEGPCVVVALEREDAIAHWRKIMGATNPEKADPGTIRKLYAESFTRNAVHGSDAPETAAQEIPFFFAASEVY